MGPKVANWVLIFKSAAYLCRVVKNWKRTISIIVCGCVAIFIFCILMSYLSQVPSHGTATPGTALLVLHAPRATRVTRPAQPARIRILTSVRVTRGTAV